MKLLELFPELKIIRYRIFYQKQEVGKFLSKTQIELDYTSADLSNQEWHKIRSFFLIQSIKVKPKF